MSSVADTGYDLEIERSILGAVFVDNANWAAAEVLPLEAFGGLAHQVMFGVMGDMARREAPINEETLIHELNLRNLLDRADGAVYVIDVGRGVPRGTNVPYFVERVLELWAGRQLHDVGSRISRLATQVSEPVAERIAEAERLLMGLIRSQVGIDGFRDSDAREGGGLLARGVGPAREYCHRRPYWPDDARWTHARTPKD